MNFARFLYLLAVLYLMEESTVCGQDVKKNEKIFSAGHWQINLKDGFGKGRELSKYVSSQRIYKHNIFQAQAGYYIVNRLLMGVGFSWSTEWSPERAEQESFTDFMKGPLLRYQFTNSRISPFLEASYQFGQRSTGPRSLLDFRSSSVHSTLLDAGMSFGLASFLQLDASYGFQFTTIADQSITYAYPQLGINCKFGSK